MFRSPITRKIFRWMALITLSAYGLQVVGVTVAYLVPEASAVHNGSKFVIKRGFGWGFDYLPLVGALSLVNGQPCRLIVTDQQSGETRVEGYDLAIDVYDKYPEVWPEKQ